MLAICLLILILPVTYAKYTDLYRLFFSQEIANPIFVVDKGETVKINDTNNVGYYEFSIKNFEKEQISDIGFSYTIEIIPKLGEIPQFELYSENQKIPIENLKTSILSIKGNEKIEQKYILKIIYDKDNIEEKNKDVGEVQIKVCSEQEKI